VAIKKVTVILVLLKVTQKTVNAFTVKCQNDNSTYIKGHVRVIIQQWVLQFYSEVYFWRMQNCMHWLTLWLNFRRKYNYTSIICWLWSITNPKLCRITNPKRSLITSPNLCPIKTQTFAPLQTHTFASLQNLTFAPLKPKTLPHYKPKRLPNYKPKP
jgi:hypothetical protein